MNPGAFCKNLAFARHVLPTLGPQKRLFFLESTIQRERRQQSYLTGMPSLLCVTISLVELTSSHPEREISNEFCSVECQLSFLDGLSGFSSPVSQESMSTTTEGGLGTSRTSREVSLSGSFRTLSCSGPVLLSSQVEVLTFPPLLDFPVFTFLTGLEVIMSCSVSLFSGTWVARRLFFFLSFFFFLFPRVSADVRVDSACCSSWSPGEWVSFFGGVPEAEDSLGKELLQASDLLLCLIGSSLPLLMLGRSLDWEVGTFSPFLESLCSVVSFSSWLESWAPPLSSDKGNAAVFGKPEPLSVVSPELRRKTFIEYFIVSAFF